MLLAAPAVTPSAAAAVRVTADPPSGFAPLGVTYRYSVTADPVGFDSVTADPVGFGGPSYQRVRVADDICSPLRRIGGDEDFDNRLDPSETWFYTCSRTFTSAGSFTSQVAASGSTATKERRSLGTAETTVTVSPPTILRVTADPLNGFAPLRVTYRYELANQSEDQITVVSVTGQTCSPAGAPSGDDGDGILDPGETWFYTCSQTFQSPGSYTNHVAATGRRAVTGESVPPATGGVTVTVSPAPPPPPTADPTFLCFLRKHVPSQGGLIFYLDASYGRDFLLGRVRQIRNPSFILRFTVLKAGRGSEECNNPAAVIQVPPQGTLGPEGLTQAYGSPTPPLPIRLAGCVPGVLPRDLPDNVTFEITGLRG